MASQILWADKYSKMDSDGKRWWYIHYAYACGNTIERDIILADSEVQLAEKIAKFIRAFDAAEVV